MDPTSSRPEWHKTFMDMLEVLAKRSTCLKIQTASMIVKDKQIKGIGYNGTFSGSKECCSYWYDEYNTNNQEPDKKRSFTNWIHTNEFKDAHRQWSLLNEIHAEVNAIKQVSKNDIQGCILYTLYSPCDLCAKDIIAHDITTIYFRYLYSRGTNALTQLRRHHVDCVQIL